MAPCAPGFWVQAVAVLGLTPDPHFYGPALCALSISQIKILTHLVLPVAGAEPGAIGTGGASAR
eukprot:1159676-Pelagomonas_calceolata.AAC.6